jgi:hypothetical protein
VTDPNFAQVGYNYPGGPSSRIVSAQERWPTERTQAMTAAGIHIRVLTGQDPRTSEIMRKGLDLCLELPPVWNPDNGSIDMYYWYYGTLAVKALGGTPWRKWSDALRDTLITHQYVRGSGTRAGSWAPLGPWGEEGGTVYMTALAVLALQETRR